MMNQILENKQTVNNVKNSKGIIYMYTNKITGKQYIGQTVNPLQRHYSHICGKNQYIDKDINEFGIENFKYEVLYSIDESITDKLEIQRLLNEKEQYYIIYQHFCFFNFFR